MNDFVKQDSRGKGAGIEKLGYTIGIVAGIILYALMKDIYAPVAITFVLGIIAVCSLKFRRVSRDYVDVNMETKRIKETYAESDNEEESDCAIDRSEFSNF